MCVYIHIFGCLPLIWWWEGSSGMVGCECPAQPCGFLLELGTFAFLQQRAAEVLWKHRSLDHDLQRRQITARLCNTQT